MFPQWRWMDGSLLWEGWARTSLQFLFFSEAEHKTKQAGYFSKPVDNDLESRFSVCHEDTIIVKDGLQDQFLNCLHFHTEVTETCPVYSWCTFHPVCLWQHGWEHQQRRDWTALKISKFLNTSSPECIWPVMKQADQGHKLSEATKFLKDHP